MRGVRGGREGGGERREGGEVGGESYILVSPPYPGY